MRDTVEIIDGPIEWVHHPLMLDGLITDYSFFAVNGVPGKFFQKQFGNYFLRLNVNLQLYIVRSHCVDPLLPRETFAKQGSRRAGSILGDVEVMLHAKSHR